MESEKLREITKIPLKKKNLTEKRKYRKHLWNMLFMELLLQKLQEKEQREAMRDEEDAPAKVCCEFTMQMDMGHPIEDGSRGGIRIMGRDSLELSLYCFESMLSCESYACLAGNVKRTEMLSSSRLLHEAFDIMQEYYLGQIDAIVLEMIFRKYCCAYIEEKEDETLAGSNHGLCEVYECFSRANARKAVLMNRNEGKGLVEDSGLSWAGTTYYNSDYYYRCKETKRLLQKVTDEVAEEYCLMCVNFNKMENETRFRMDGGLSYHGVFEWTQMQNNFPSKQYGMKDKEKEPPENFIYLYRNGYSATEEKGMRRLEQNMKKLISDKVYTTELWRSFCISGGKEYHNGASYLLEQKRTGKEDEEMYHNTMKFLDTFRLYRVSGCVELLSVGK